MSFFDRWRNLESKHGMKQLESYRLDQCQPSSFSAYFFCQKTNKLYRQEGENFMYIETNTLENLTRIFGIK